MKTTGSFGASFPDGSLQGFFSCTGYPTCLGTYTAAFKDSFCPNVVTVTDTITVTGLNLDQPGPIQGVVTLTNIEYSDGKNADGTCFIRPGTSKDRSLPYTGTWNGSSGSFVMTTTNEQGKLVMINGTFTANIPTAKPVFPMEVRGSVTPTVANITAEIQFRPQDVGSSGSVFVFARAPATLVKDAIVAKDEALGTAKDTPVQCVLAQLNGSGQLQAVSASSMQAYVSGVLSSQGQAVSVLNNVSTPQIAGATFFVGYGASAATMINSGVNRSVVTVPASQTCQPQAPQTGWWWNPAEGGRGFSLEVQNNNIFFASYLYDTSGRATWLAANGPTSLEGSFYSGRLLSFAKGQTLTGAWRAPDPAVDNGAITLAFNDATHGTLIWPGGTLPIERFVIGTNGLAAPPQSNQPENGWWWNAQEGGRGYFLEWQGSDAFAAGYMYDTFGNPLWYASLATTPNAQAFQGSWLQLANGQTLTGAYKPPSPTSVNVGALGIQFQNPITATLTLPDGRQIAITRFRF